jgi:A/G-specific adenine glycosylase
MDFFNLPLHSWFSLYKRDLPWRDTIDPYKIWLSEIILQQTRIDQGLDYYNRFVDEFPTISDLANAPEDKVLKLWQGLGYYSRARNLHYTAQYVAKHHSGVFPSTYKDIIALKGVGEYTAAAIASISFKLEYPTVDGNVFRVLSRYFGIFDPIDSTIGKKTFLNLAKELIKGTDPAMHNQALMEFGALQCTPKNPDCVNCPFIERCFAFTNQKISELPVKQNKVKQRDRYFNYLVIDGKNDLYIRKREENDIWRNLYEFPLVETDNEVDVEEILSSHDFQDVIPAGSTPAIEKISNWRIHILSHQRIHYRFILIQPVAEFKCQGNIIRVNKEDIFNFAVPRLLEIFLNEYLKNNSSCE